MPLLANRLLLGLALGVISRVWMRLISNEPEFSWGGTAVVVGVFVLSGLGTGISLMMSAGGRTRDVIGRGVGLLMLLPSFLGAGAQIMPGVTLGSLSLHRNTWKPWIRILFGLLALVQPVGIVVEELLADVSLWRVLGLLMFMATYVALVFMTAPIFRPRRAGTSSIPTNPGR
ncbi:MAG: hypothetical protein ACO3VN_06690 [Ilumatobacteraceae bacterium]